MLTKHDETKPLFVEGGYTVWLREKSLTYFTLRSDPTQKILDFVNYEVDEEKENDISAGFFSYIGKIYCFVWAESPF